jgi:hypothetical protein
MHAYYKVLMLMENLPVAVSDGVEIATSNAVLGLSS